MIVCQGLVEGAGERGSGFLVLSGSRGELKRMLGSANSECKGPEAGVRSEVLPCGAGVGVPAERVLKGLGGHSQLLLSGPTMGGLSPVPSLPCPRPMGWDRTRGTGSKGGRGHGRCLRNIYG